MASLEPLRAYLDDPERRYVDIAVNAPGRIWVEEVGRGSRPVDDPRITLDWAADLLRRLANLTHHDYDARRQPIVRASLPGKHRFNGAIGAHFPLGMAISIRVRRGVAFPLDRYRMTDAQTELLRRAAAEGAPIAICGWTNTGKTTLFNSVIAELYPRDQRLFVVQDVDELDVPHENKVLVTLNTFRQAGGDGGGTGVGWGQIIDFATQHNPGRIVCSELNTENALPIARLLTTGHANFAVTAHCASPKGFFSAWGSNYEISTGRDPRALVRRVWQEWRDGVIVQLRREYPDTRYVSDVVRGAEVPIDDLL
jgi:type IV secretory pathway ATPase VirB11/archaellum biosynthesis ATPase